MKIQCAVHGQGVFIFNASSPCSFSLLNKTGEQLFNVAFTNTSVVVTGSEPLIDPANTSGITDLSGAYYWFSLDSQNHTLYAGIGEARLDTAIYKYVLKADSKALLESITTIDYSTDITLIKMLKDPITKKVPLLIKDIHELTMMHIAQASYMPLSNLSMVSQRLYKCIAGKRFHLNDKSFPNFAKAIQRSIVTPGLWCNTKLQEKATEFSKDKPNLKETYLRITLGENSGESPGIPYVMEIWPAGHYSPVHSHSQADAIIRVLHGGIHVKLFPFLCTGKEAVEPFAAADFKKDNSTWISPTLNQVHQLKNITTDVCVTIQCYMYENNDNTHYDYFDYLDPDGKKQKYEPDSDMDFVNFKNMMEEEWNARPRCLPF